MTALILILALLAWLVAAYALVRIGMSCWRIWRAAPAGQGMSAMVELWSLNYAAVLQRVGETARPDVERVAKNIKLFAVCIFTLVALVVINIITGGAA